MLSPAHSFLGGCESIPLCCSMEDLAPSSSLFISPDKEEKMVPSSPAGLPTTSTSTSRNVGTVLLSSSVFCLFIRWGLPRLINLFNSSSPALETATVSDLTSGRPYDVFLNHRGPDVKQTLASPIYHWIEGKGVRVFLDREEFQAGEGLHPTIKRTISSAFVHIAILSKRYAESSWCLDELCLMLESDAKIIPVFYDVQPSELRWISKRKGVYVSAFTKHQKKHRVPSQKLDQWKAALEQVSYLHGLELHGPEFKGDLGRLLKSIANAVSEAVAEKSPLGSVRDPVGLNEAVQDFRNFMQCETQHMKGKLKIVGIVGFGGSGKTTLAKELLKTQQQSYGAVSFLPEVRHAAAQHKLQSLQGKLLYDLLRISDNRIEGSSVMDGRAILRNKLRSWTLPVLIILDDIDDENQVEYLLDTDALGLSGLILITSREESVLRKSGAYSIYKMKPLDSDHALELFCRHAFLQPRPKTGFEDLAEKFCRKCGGFPLFLKVIGAHLRVCGNEDKHVWNDELEYIPDCIKNIFESGYAALAIEEKQMLLDVACFFVGENESTAIRAWSGLDRRAFLRLQNLERKCLVEVNKNCLRMHDYLKDFGRKIAERDSSCRFWHPRQFTNIREQLEGGKEVRGIIAATGEFSYDLTLESPFENMDLSKLKFLAIKGRCFEWRFEQQATKPTDLTNLTWLRWYDCPQTNFPSPLISMRNLTVLHIFGGALTEWTVCDTPLPLKELAIQETGLSSLSISEDTYPQLQHLDLSDNHCLANVNHLPRTLVLLNLCSCTTLEIIPTSFHLEKLKSLNISGCCQLKELPDLKHLTSLETLQAWDCSMLQHIGGLERLLTLRDLNVSRCLELVKLPNLSDLILLETLDTSGCSRLLNIEGLERLSKLQQLIIDGCSELRDLPDLSGLSSLKTLRAMGCDRLQNIVGLENLSNLQHSSVNEVENYADNSSTYDGEGQDL